MNNCPKCRKDCDIHPTPPTSTVEEIWDNYKTRMETLDRHLDNDRLTLGEWREGKAKISREATQAITRLIQQAELRGRIDALENVDEKIAGSVHDRIGMAAVGYHVHGLLSEAKSQLDQLRGSDD